jgi:hypothetical protein
MRQSTDRGAGCRGQGKEPGNEVRRFHGTVLGPNCRSPAANIHPPPAPPCLPSLARAPQPAVDRPDGGSGRPGPERLSLARAVADGFFCAARIFVCAGFFFLPSVLRCGCSRPIATSATLMIASNLTRGSREPSPSVPGSMLFRERGRRGPSSWRSSSSKMPCSFGTDQAAPQHSPLRPSQAPPTHRQLASITTG